MTRSGKRLRVKTAIDGVGGKQSTKKQNFCCQKNPHPELRSAALLLDSLELLVDQRCGGITRRIHNGRDPAAAGARPKLSSAGHINENVRCGAPSARRASCGRALPSSVDASNVGKIKIDIFLS